MLCLIVSLVIVDVFVMIEVVGRYSPSIVEIVSFIFLAWSRGIDGEMVKGMSWKLFFLPEVEHGVSGDLLAGGLWFLRVGVECVCLMCSLLLF